MKVFEVEETLPASEEAAAMFDEYMADFKSYACEFLRIQTEEGQLVNFEVNEVQEILEGIIRDIKDRGGLVRLIILKARREGVSTYTCGRYFWRTSTDFNKYSFIVAHEPEATDFLFGMVKRFYKNLPQSIQPSIMYSNKKMLEFNVTSEQKRSGKVGLDSAFRVGTAGKEDLGSAQLIHYLHLSEVAKWPAGTATPLLTSLLQTVPDTPETEIIFESTGKGIGGEFYTRYWGARFAYSVYLDGEGHPQFKMEVNPNSSPDNTYCSIFIPWFVFKKYAIRPTPGFQRTDDESKLVELYGITDDKLMWRRWCIENKCGGSVDLFNQEYPDNARSAFLSSGRAVFDVQKCQALAEMAAKPIATYELEVSTGNFVTAKEGRLRVWEEPKRGVAYTIAADVAEGLVNGDFNCADIQEHLTKRTVAQWHGKIDPDQFAYVLYWLGKRYNTAWLIPERNNHGLIVVTRLVELEYPNLYHEQVFEPPNQYRKRWGWFTGSSKTKGKPLIIDNMVAALREDCLGVVDAETYKEMMSFVIHDDGSLGAVDGMYDDRIMAKAINLFASSLIKTPHSASAFLADADKPVSRRGIMASRDAKGWT